MKTKTILSLLLILFGGMSTFAQDARFTQNFSNPLFLNPAYSGSLGCSRIVLNCRKYFPVNVEDFHTYSASYDQYVKPILGGIGLQFLSDHNGAETSTSINGSYAINLKLKDNLHIRPAIKLGVGLFQRDFSFYGLSNHISHSTYFNLGAGVLLTYKNFISGFSFDHINTYNKDNFDSTSQYQQPKLIIHCNYQFDINEKILLTPGIIFFKQEDYKEIVYNVCFKYGFIKAGIGFSQGFDNPDGAMLMLGYFSDRLSIGYSYDFTVSKLYNEKGATHEITALFKFNCKNDKENFKITQLFGF